MKRFIETPINNTYDMIVIGGGISGAAVAYEAASQGYTVALVEKGDFGAGTSAATSKLIHGGLRYLANFELGLVRESLKERKTLENIAPNFVYPLPFLVPLYSDIKLRNKFILEPGMMIYDLLSYDKGFTWDKSKRLPWHRLLSAEKAAALESIVQTSTLTGAILFYDCANLNPERLTLAFIKSAVKHGADVANYARVEGFMREAGRISGVVVRDLLNGTTLNLRSKLFINCGGPWADILLDIARGKPGSNRIRRSEGIHIVTRKITNANAAVGALIPTGRACNLIPWRGHTLIGTTDREYIGDPDAYSVTREKIEAYIAEVNAALYNPGLIKYEDVCYAYGGLRPLVDDQTEDVHMTSRKYEIFDHAVEGLPGLVTVEGGKYTTSRNLAENVLKTVAKKFGRPAKSVTARKHLVGSEIADIEAFVAAAKAKNRDFSEPAIDYLARLYGTELNSLLELARSDKMLAAPLNSDGEMAAQALYAIRHEMARTLTDIFIRRTGLGTLGYTGDAVTESIANVVSRELGWDSARAEKEMEAVKKAMVLPA